MSNDLDKKGFQKRLRINTNENYEVAYWTNKFGVTKEQLEEAIDAAESNLASEVQKALSIRKNFNYNLHTNQAENNQMLS
ncbi:DUF3606 domain-containing protein [Pseudomonas shirazensis]